MKNIIVGILIVGAALAASAQTITTNQVPNQLPTESAATFFNSAGTYLTSFNTNYSWSAVTFDASIGYKQVTGSGANSVANIDYDGFGKFILGGTAQFQGTGSAVGVLGLIAGYAIIEHYDVRVDAELQGGYSWYQSTGYVEPGVYINKKLTDNTFARIGLSLPEYFKGTVNRNPSFEVSLGFTY